MTRDPRAMLRTAATLMKTIVESLGYDYDDVITKLIDEAPTPARQVAHSLMGATVACVVSGEHLWDPITDHIILTERASRETVAEVVQHIADTFRDGYTGSEPELWDALELHYRRTYPEAWPPGDDQGREFYVTSSYEPTGGGWRHSNVVLEVRDGDDTTVHLLEPADADLVGRLLRWEVSNPRPIPVDMDQRVRNNADAPAADEKPGLRVVRDDDGGH